MSIIRTSSMLSASLALVALSAMTLTGCEKKSEPSKPVETTTPSPAHDDHDHAHADGHDHDHAAGDDHDHDDGHDHGPATALGEQTAGGFTIKASRDGTLKAGGDAPVDVLISGGTAKVAAVRFWIGVQDAKGSIKAKAELEKENWHTHVEVPSPLPEGSKLWVEVESDKGDKAVAGFDLKS